MLKAEGMKDSLYLFVWTGVDYLSVTAGSDRMHNVYFSSSGL